MLTIGFATKYYTLWDVTGPHEVNYGTHLATIMRYTYIQNLSFDRNKAVEKVRDRVGNDYKVDLSLRGAKSYERTLSVEYNSSQFLFGRHVGKPFSEVDDDGYLTWYWSQTNNTDKESEELEDYLVDRGLLFRLSDGSLYDEKGLSIYLSKVFTDKIYKLGHYHCKGDRITVEAFVRNIYGYDTSYGWMDVIEMIDMSNGRLYYVRGSMKGIDTIKEGDSVSITGTIAHKEWFDRKLGKQRKETQLKRAKLESVFS